MRLSLLILLAVFFSTSQGNAGEKDKPLRVCLVSGSVEYNSDDTLPILQKHLETKHRMQCSRAFRKTDKDLPGLENLDSCDVMVLFTRRLTIDGEQLERVKKFALSGKPIVGIRTASHAFQKWLDLDKLILGGNYKGHFGEGPLCKVAIVDKQKDHPILKGVKPFESKGSLYKNTGVASDVTILLEGSIPGHTEPIAWTRETKGGRVFYTSLGHPADFAEPDFVRLLTNAIYWTTKRTHP